MITARDVDVQAGGYTLVGGASFTVAPGDKIGLVGRNGAGKTTLMRVLAGEASPSAGAITRAGSIGYLPQDARVADLDLAVSDRILSVRKLDETARALRTYAAQMSAPDQAGRERAMRAYARAEAEFIAGGGYAAEAEAARVVASLGLPQDVLSRPLRALSGGQRRRVELARVLFGGADTLMLDEPANHLDADSINWLRGFLASHSGGLVLISHETRLLDETVNRVFHLDSSRAELDVYNVGWKTYLTQREVDGRRRKRQRVNAERKAQSLLEQADRRRANVKTAVAAKNMERRARQMLAELEPERALDKIAKIKLPQPASCGRLPLAAVHLSKSYGSLEVFTSIDLAVDKASRLVVIGLNGAGKTTLLRILAGHDEPDTGAVVAGHGLILGYFAQEHDTLEPTRTVRQTLQQAAPELSDGQARALLGSFLFSGDDVDKLVKFLSGGEKTRLALATLVSSGANVLLLDEPTNNLDPVSRQEILRAIREYQGAIVLVTHDRGAVEALEPTRVLILPDGTEDLWSSDYTELVSYA